MGRLTGAREGGQTGKEVVTVTREGVTDGEIVGLVVGVKVGEADEKRIGDLEGLLEDENEGAADRGCLVGRALSLSSAKRDGREEGACTGEKGRRLLVGWGEEGADDGWADGLLDGVEDGSTVGGDCTSEG